MQVKVLRNIGKMRKKGGDIRTGQIGRQFLDALGM